MTIKNEIMNVVEDIISDYKYEIETDRETLIERLDEECNNLFGQLVQHGPISEYNIQDMANTATECSEIIELAEADAWVENDTGLWEGLTYGMHASVAYFSLRNLLYQYLKDEGYDSNEDTPFWNDEIEAEFVEGWISDIQDGYRDSFSDWLKIEKKWHNRRTCITSN